MRLLKTMASIAALSSLAVSGVAAAAGTRAVEQGAAGGTGGQQCAVSVRSNGSNELVNVLKRVLPNGDCVCVATSGPKPTDPVQGIINQLRQTGDCADAPVEIVKGGGGGLPGGVLPVVVVGGAAAGAALGSGDDSPGG